MSAKWEKLLFDVAINRDFLLNGRFCADGLGLTGHLRQALPSIGKHMHVREKIERSDDAFFDL